jgi:coenzyme F420-reducing hydrogenase delta subunit
LAEIINLPCLTKLDLTAERVLEGALAAGLDGVLVLGYDKDGNIYMASSYADGGTVIWLMEKCKKRLLDFTVPMLDPPPKGTADVLPMNQPPSGNTP